MLSENAAPDFGRSVVRIASDQAAIEWSTRITADSDTLDSAFIFIVNGAIGIIRKWLDGDLDKSSEEMSNLIFSLAFNGLSACMKQ